MEDDSSGGEGCHPAAKSGGRDRLEFVSDDAFDLNPHSLVGSWFLRLEDGDVVWLGAVVGEPAQGVYLLSVDRLAPGANRVQRLVKLDQMSDDDDGNGWRFYDDEESCRVAWAAWLVAVND